MNKILSICIALCAAASVSAESEDALGRTWTYSVAGGKATVEGVTPDAGEMNIPRQLGGVPVTRIGDGAFGQCDGLAGVTIPDSVTIIGARAFSDCGKLARVSVPASVTTIGEGAFSGCGALKSMPIHKGVTTIGPQAFARCDALTTFVVDVGNSKFSARGGLLCSKDGKTLVQGVNGDVAIPSGVTSVGDSAFYGLGGLTSVTLPASVTDVGAHAFDFCNALTFVDVDAGNPKFKSVDGLLCSKDGKTVVQGVNGDVTIPSGVTDIGAGAFSGRAGLASVTMPASVTNLGARAFEACGGLVSLELGEGLTQIGNEAFFGCDALQTVAIPASVETIDISAFGECGGIWSFDVAEDNPNYSSVNGMLCSKDGTRLIRGVNGSVTIPPGVTRIEASAFAGCKKLVAVSIPASVTSIGKGAFDDTPLYASQPEGLLVFGNIVCGVKGNCPSLVMIPAGTTGIGDSAFEGRGELKSVKIPACVTAIGDGAFAGCSDLKLVYVDEEAEIERVRGLYAWAGGVTFKAVEVHEFVVGEKVNISTGLSCHEAQGLPPGMCFNMRTGVITGAGKSAGEYEVTFTSECSSTEMMTIIITEENISLDTEAIAAAMPCVGLNGEVKIQALADFSGVKSISVSGQPKGMKFDKKTSSLVGAPTKSGEITMKVTVTTVGGTKKVFEIPVTVAAPESATVGTFNGLVEPADVNGASVCGTIVFTSSEAGKLTAKVTTPSGTFSLSKTGWDSCEDGIYAVTLSNKKCTLDLSLDAEAEKDVHQLVGTFDTSDGSSFAVSAQCKFFGTSCRLSATGDSTKGWTLAAAPDAKSANLSVTVKADGSTSLSGTLDGIKVKATGSVNVSGRSEGVLLAEFVQVVSVKSGKKTVKRPLYFRIELLFDSKESTGTTKGTALFAE